MSFLLNDFRALYTSLYQVDLEMLQSLWSHRMATEMAIGKYLFIPHTRPENLTNIARIHKRQFRHLRLHLRNRDSHRHRSRRTSHPNCHPPIRHHLLLPRFPLPNHIHPHTFPSSNPIRNVVYPQRNTLSSRSSRYPRRFGRDRISR